MGLWPDGQALIHLEREKLARQRVQDNGSATRSGPRVRLARVGAGSVSGPSLKLLAVLRAPSVLMGMPPAVGGASLPARCIPWARPRARTTPLQIAAGAAARSRRAVARAATVLVGRGGAVPALLVGGLSTAALGAVSTTAARVVSPA
jgi:hypothetical protein